VSTTKLFSPNPTLGYSELLALLEFGFVRVHDLPPPSKLRYEGPGTFLPGDAAIDNLQHVPQQRGGFATANSSGFNLLLRATYNNVFPSVQIKPSFRWSMGLHGVTPVPLINFVDKVQQINPNLQFVLGNSTSLDLGYTRFVGGGQSNLLIDRDFVSLDAKYSF